MSWTQSAYISAEIRDVRVSSFLAKVYGWMAAGLMLTASTGLIVASTGNIFFWILRFIGNRRVVE